MTHRAKIWVLAWLLCGLCHAGWRDWLSPSGPCPGSLVQELYQSGQKENFPSYSTFKRWINRLPRYHGLTVELVKKRYEYLNTHPELIALMKGIDVPSGRENTSLRVSGGWGQDFLFIPSFPLWEAVHQNFEPLVDRMGTTLHLHPILVQQMFRGDHTGIGDSAWVIAEWPDDAAIKRATLKITFFDREMTPDGPFPRFSFESALADYFWTTYRLPRQLSPLQADLALEGFFSLKSSLDFWGLLPLESLTHALIPEHQSANYDPQFAGLFDDPFLVHHRALMITTIEDFKSERARTTLSNLHEFRTRRIPPGALEVAELGRFNIPEGAPPAVKAQLYYGATLLLRARNIQHVYLLAPKPAHPSGHRTGPRFEVFSVAPGWTWLAKLAEEVAREHDERDPRPEPPGPPPRDPLKQMYEALGFETLSSPDYVFGLPSGAHVMRSPLNRFLGRVGDYQLRHGDHLSTSQLRIMSAIREALNHAGE